MPFPAGAKHTREARDKMSKSMSGMPKSDEHRAKIAAGQKLAWQDPEKRARVIAAQTESRRPRLLTE